MKYLPVSPDLERIINKLDPVATTKLLRPIIATSDKTEAVILSQATSLVSIISNLQLIDGGNK